MEKYIIEGLDCASCAAKVEEALRKEKGLESTMVNFLNKTITFSDGQLVRVQKIVSTVEPGVTLKALNSHDHHEVEEGIFSKELVKIALAFLFGIMGFLWSEGSYILFMIAYLIVGYEVLIKAVKNLFNRSFMDENFLMSIATIGAILINELPEAVGVMLFYNIGEYFQGLAVNRSRRSIKALLKIQPEVANLVVEGGIRQVKPEEVSVGEIVLVKPGEKVPLDGSIIEGASSLDTSALTGESLPKDVEVGDEVLAGMINIGGVLRIRVERTYENSSVSRILHLVEEAANRKAPTEKFITKFARVYTPIVVFSALALATLPPLFISGAHWEDWFYRALVLLVISCPCALVISIPLSYFGGIGGASKKGILIKGANYLEALRQVDKVVFDKTGTLTRGEFSITETKPVNGFTKEELLEVAAYGEAHSTHPIGKALREAYTLPLNLEKVNSYMEQPGYGIKAQFEGQEILVGNAKLMTQEDIQFEIIESTGTVVYVAFNKKFMGTIVLKDIIKDEAEGAIRLLKEKGIREIIILTGDREETAKEVALALGVEKVYAGLLPGDKVSKLEEIMKVSGGKVLFVGDGINDAPVISRADVGMAMGGLGSQAAIEAADVVIMRDDLTKVPLALKISHFTRRIVIQNIIFALGVKGIFILMGAFGVATLWEAVFADVGVALLAVLNASRVINMK